MSQYIKRLPEEFFERLRKIVPANKVNPVLRSFESRRPTTFRANTLKITPFDLKERLEHDGFSLRQVNWYREAFILKGDKNKLVRTELYNKGFIYVQSLSSMVPVLLLKPQPNEKILDITAAPGSKTTQMAVMMENKGEIIANDISTIRIEKLKANLHVQGVTNVKIETQDARSLWKSYPEYFDKTLVDVPCSLEGRFNIHDRKSYSGWSVKNIKKLANQSKWILRSAASATTVGGRIVYSTCTLAPEENEEVIDWIMNKEKGKIMIEEAGIPGLPLFEALSEWQGKEYNQEVLKTKRIIPTELMEGFYVAVLRKVKSNLE